MSTYLRYLIDICESVILVPPNDLKVNPDSGNPFKVAANCGFRLKEEIIEPDDKVLIKEVPFT